MSHMICDRPNFTISFISYDLYVLKDSKYGWSNDDPDNDSITWENSKADVQKVELQFREKGDSKYAQIADLKINYCIQH